MRGTILDLRFVITQALKGTKGNEGIKGTQENFPYFS
jgi:hypothetical protein